MRAKDIMSRDVVSVDKDDRLESVLERMVKHRVSKLVVLDHGGSDGKDRVVGVIIDGDIADELGAIKNRGVPASHLHASSAMRRRFPHVSADADVGVLVDALVAQDAGIVPITEDGSMPVGVVTASDLLSLVRDDRPLADIMTTQLTVAAPTDRVIHARRLMLDHHVERLPVLDHGRLVGLVGELDIALGLARFKERVADHFQSAALQRLLVRDVMQQTLVTATPEMTARDAIATLRREDVGSLPVVRGDRLVGMVTRTDLLKLVPR